jgi:streptogramin lyase
MWARILPLAVACHLVASVAFAQAPTFQGTFTESDLNQPRGIAVGPSGDVFVGAGYDGGSHIARFTGTGTLTSTWSLGGALQSVVPNGVAVDGSGVVFVTDGAVNRIRKFTSNGFLFSTFVTAPQPVDVALDGANEVFVMAAGAMQVQKFTNSGALLAAFGSAGAGPGQFQDPQGLAVDGSGRVYVADHARMRIIRFLAGGSFDMEFATPVPPSDVAVGPDGNVYVISPEFGSVYRYSSSGMFQFAFGSPAGLSYVWRICVGPTGAIYITEQSTRRVTKFQIDLATSATHTTFGRLKAMYR